MTARKTSSIKLRSSGQQSVEFAAAMALLVGCVFVPLIDAGIIPVRFGLASSCLDSLTQQLSRTETLTNAYEMLDSDSGPKTMLKKIGGVKLKETQLTVEITSAREPMDTLTIYNPRTFPTEWLPEGNHCPCDYSLHLSVKTEIYPLILAPSLGRGIPGLTAPLPVTFNTRSNWENLGRNPVTREFFLNE